MTCAQGFCVPVEMPEFAAACKGSNKSTTSNSQSSGQDTGSASARGSKTFVLPASRSSEGSNAPKPPPSPIISSTFYGAMAETAASFGELESASAAAAAKANSTVKLREGGGASADLRTVGHVSHGNASQYSHEIESGSGAAPPPGNNGVPVEVIVPVGAGRRLLTQVKLFISPLLAISALPIVSPIQFEFCLQTCASCHHCPL